jgi:hypothetical protein
MTRLLLELDAPLNIRDTIFQSTPLAWAARWPKHYGGDDDKNAPLSRPCWMRERIGAGQPMEDRT